MTEQHFSDQEERERERERERRTLICRSHLRFFFFPSLRTHPATTSPRGHHAAWTDACLAAGTTVNGGQTVLNPWMIVGGVASSVVTRGEFIQ